MAAGRPGKKQDEALASEVPAVRRYEGCLEQAEKESARFAEGLSTLSTELTGLHAGLAVLAAESAIVRRMLDEVTPGSPPPSAGPTPERLPVSYLRGYLLWRREHGFDRFLKPVRFGFSGPGGADWDRVEVDGS